MAVLREIVTQYKYISLDCKFPGIVARPIGTFKTTSEYHYQTLRTNVDVLTVVQVGMTFSDEYGNRPPNSTWQFNFKFNESEDMASKDGLEILRQSGVNFDMLAVEGIDVFSFAELLLTSGLVLDSDINWITFHSGYDLGYLLSVMLNASLPAEEGAFLDLVKLYFPNVWDLKYILRGLSYHPPRATLYEVAEDFHHMSGGNNSLLSAIIASSNEALLTSAIYFEMRKGAAEPTVAKFANHFFGLGEGLGNNNGNNGGGGSSTGSSGNNAGAAGGSAPSSSAAGNNAGGGSSAPASALTQKLAGSGSTSSKIAAGSPGVRTSGIHITSPSSSSKDT